jgi:hypothetical protein
MPDTSSIFSSLSAFAALMAGISIATERLVEMVKGAVPILANPWKKHDQIRAAIVQLLAAVAGAAIASQMPGQIQNAMPATWGLLHWQGYAVIGLMSSGGAGVWNHLLDILGAVKAKQEISATDATVNLRSASVAAGLSR